MGGLTDAVRERLAGRESLEEKLADAKARRVELATRLPASLDSRGGDTDLKTCQQPPAGDPLRRGCQVWLMPTVPLAAVPARLPRATSRRSERRACSTSDLARLPPTWPEMASSSG